MGRGSDRMRRRRAAAGFSLVELCAVLAVLAIVAGLAWPSHADTLRRARRADATAALQRLQLAQEQYRARQGRYAERLDQLPGFAAALSGEGLYRLELERVADDRYQVRAIALADQARDTACPRLTLQVDGAITQRGPEARCWLP